MDGSAVVLRFLRLLSLVTFGYVLGNYTADVLASPKGVILHGQLFEGDPAQEECRFILDPEGDSESVSLVGTPQGYLCDYLRGTKNVEITIVPVTK